MPQTMMAADFCIGMDCHHGPGQRQAYSLSTAPEPEPGITYSVRNFLPRTWIRILNLSLLPRGPLFLEDQFTVLNCLSSKVSLSLEKER